MKIILGSSSTARREILSEMGYQFTVMTAGIDEKAIRREKPEELVMALAEAKAEAIMLKVGDNCVGMEDGPILLITSDQVMMKKGMVREKPRTAEEAREFIKGYSRDQALAVNYVLVTNLGTGARRGGWDIPQILFHHIPDDFMDNVVKERDIIGVAGGFKLTHPLALPFVKEVVGTMDSVRGLPKKLTERLIQEALGAE